MATDHGIVAMEVDLLTLLTLEEFCAAICTNETVLLAMVEYQVVQPQSGNTPADWRFDATSLKRGKMAASFYQELEINLPGVALAIELMDKINQLQQEVSILKKLID